jgi:hypothetical protein
LSLQRQRCKKLQRNEQHTAFIELKLVFPGYFKTLYPITPLALGVTRLGEFSPPGRWFSLGRFLKIAKVTQILGLHFSTEKVMY